MELKDLIEKVAKQELEFLLSQAEEYCEDKEELAEWKKDVHDPLKKKFVNCESIDDLRAVLEEEIGVENSSEYILDNYIITK
jgi:uncharacterized protein (UPF0335 family)